MWATSARRRSIWAATTMSDATTGGREDQHQRDRQLDQDAGHGAGTATTAVP